MLTQNASSEMLHLVSFKLGEEEFALEITQIQEINRVSQVTQIPNSESYVCGVINLRGKVIPVVDLGEKFGLPRRDETKDARIMVVGLKDLGRVGLRVDSVREVLRLREDTLDPPPAMIRGISAEFIRGIGKLEDRLILLLDLSRLFEEVRLSRMDCSPPPVMEPAVRVAPSAAAVPVQASAPDPVLQEIVEAAKAMAEGNFQREVHSDLYGQVGELAKYINTTLKKLQSLEPNVKLTSEKIPQASVQLSEITKTTEEATHKVMSYIEQILENRDLVSAQLGQLEHLAGGLEGARPPMKEIRRIVAEDQEVLMEVMTGLSFQDLTGQKIKKIITLVEEIEKRIIHLLVTFGIRQERREEILQEVAANQDIKQDRVDDILKQFGF